MTHQHTFDRPHFLSSPAQLVLALALLTAALGARPMPLACAAGVITVNTTADELNSDTDCSLREAIQSANTNTDISGCAHTGTAPYTINLPDGTYVLDFGRNLAPANPRPSVVGQGRFPTCAFGTFVL